MKYEELRDLKKELPNFPITEQSQFFHILGNVKENICHRILLVYREYLVFFVREFIVFVPEKQDIFHFQEKEFVRYIEIIDVSEVVLRMQGFSLIEEYRQSFFLYFPDEFPSSLVLIFL